MRLLIALAVCACNPPKRPASTDAHAPTTRAYPAPLYAGLFLKGSQQTYTFESRHWHWDDQDPLADAEGTVVEEGTGSMTCTVVEVRELRAAIASRVECEVPSTLQLVADDGPGGIYVATAAGLWRAIEMPSVAPTATKGGLFTPSPVAGVTEERDPRHPDHVMRIAISQDGRGVWCRREEWTTAHPGVAELCVGGGTVVSGSFESDGSQSRSFSYRIAPTSYAQPGIAT